MHERPWYSYIVIVGGEPHEIFTEGKSRWAQVSRGSQPSHSEEYSGVQENFEDYAWIQLMEFKEAL